MRAGFRPWWRAAARAAAAAAVRRSSPAPNATRGFSTLNRSQETLTTLAADTGGRAFTDSNDFGKAFDEVQDDLAAYYLIGYTSSNSRRRRQVPQDPGAAVEGTRQPSRHGPRRLLREQQLRVHEESDREAQLTDQLSAAVSSTDVPMVVGTGWFRRSADSYFVPIAMVDARLVGAGGDRARRP